MEEPKNRFNPKTPSRTPTHGKTWAYVQLTSGRKPHGCTQTVFGHIDLLVRQKEGHCQRPAPSRILGIRGNPLHQRIDTKCFTQNLSNQSRFIHTSPFHNYL